VRVLLVSASFAPEQTGTGPYSGELAAGLAVRGVDVEVLALPPHFPGWRVEPADRVAGLERVETTAEGAVVHRLRGYVPRTPDAPRRLAFEAAFTANALRASRRLRRPDVVVAVSPPLLEVPAAQAMARRWRVPCVMHIQDLVPGVAAASGMVSSSALLRLAGRIERAVYRRADLITVISPGFQAYLAGLGFAARTVVLPNWVRAEDRRAGVRRPELRKELGVGEDGFAAVYSGTISRKQGVELLLDAGAHPGAHGLRILAIGEGANRPLLEAGVASGAAPALTLQPLQPRERVPDVLASCDAALLPQLPGVGSTTLPGKLITYMAAGLPVVAAADEASDAVRLIRSLDCGLVVRPGDAAALVRALHELRADPAAARERGLRGRAYVSQELDPDRLLDRWVELLAAVAAGDLATAGDRPAGRTGRHGRHD
jgi:colanic acid biosynthesis glycosyl transferase WcaI